MNIHSPFSTFLHHADRWNLGQHFPARHTKEDLSEILRHVPIFRDLNQRELQILTRIVHTRSYQPDEIIFMENEPGAGMYVIESGGVDIILNHASDKPLYLAQLDAGDFFGEMALLGDPERSATARAPNPFL